MPIEVASPVSLLTSSIPERLPGWLASAGSTDSLKSLMAWFNSVFLYLDRITPAYISHLHERKGAWNGWGQKEVPVRNQVLAASPLRDTRGRLRGQSAPSQGRSVKARGVGRQQMTAVLFFRRESQAPGSPRACTLRLRFSPGRA